MRRAKFTLLIVPFFAAAALAASDRVAAEDSLTAMQVVENVNDRDDGAQVTRKLTMTLTDKRGKQRVRETYGYRKYFDEEKRTILFYTSPSNIKDTAFLTFDYPDSEVDDDQWLYLPAARKVRRISSADRGGYFLGTDFTYEDIKNEGKFEPSDYNYTLAGKETVDGIECYVLEGTPKSEEIAKELGYGKVRSWIDPNIWMTRKADFWDIRMNDLKSTAFSRIEEIDGIWTALDLTVKNHKTGHTTEFTFEDIDYKSAVDDDIFSERALRRGA